MGCGLVARYIYLPLHFPPVGISTRKKVLGLRGRTDRFDPVTDDMDRSNDGDDDDDDEERWAMYTCVCVDEGVLCTDRLPAPLCTQ